MSRPACRRSPLPLLVAVAAWLSLGIASADPPAPAVPADPPAPAVSAPKPLAAGQVLIPEGTQVHLTLLKDLKSGGNKAGEEVPFEVAKDVYGPGRVLLIAANTPAFGKVQESSRRGMFGKAGKLKFTVDYVLTPDKARVPLRSDAQVVRGRDNRTTAIATAILLAPIAVFINGKDVTVNKGQDFTMYVNSETVVPSPSAAPQAGAGLASPAPAKSLFILADGSQVLGTLTGFDGGIYTVATEQGLKTLKAADVKSVFALASTPAAPAAAK